MVSVPERAAPVFAATENATDPLPLPEAPEDTVIHDAFDAAVHAQPFDVVTFTEPLPPPAATFCEFPESEKEQLKASCCTVNVWPAMVSVPLRAGPALAAALNVIVLPVAPATAQVPVFPVLHDIPAGEDVTLPPPTTLTVMVIGSIQSAS